MWESAHRRVGSARGRLGARAIPLRSAAPPTHRTLGLLTAGLVAWCWMGALRCEGSHLHAAVRLRVQCSGSCSSGALGTLLRGSPPFEAFRRPPPVVVRWRSVGRSEGHAAAAERSGARLGRAERTARGAREGRRRRSPCAPSGLRLRAASRPPSSSFDGEPFRRDVAEARGGARRREEDLFPRGRRTDDTPDRCAGSHRGREQVRGSVIAGGPRRTRETAEEGPSIGRRSIRTSSRPKAGGRAGRDSRRR